MFPNQGAANNGAPLGGTNPSAMDSSTQAQHDLNYNGLEQQQQPSQQQQAQPPTQRGTRRKPYVRIIEQPAGKALRFRYECEGRSAGSIPGVNSTPENKTYPTIEIVGYKGRAVVVVSCVTKDPPYKPHPHNLVGKEGCKKGVCTLEINSETMRAVFSNLGIQCVKKKDIEAALKAREEIRVDPFKTGFAHRFNPSSIDLNSVRLCFQVFMESEQRGRFTQPLAPVVSDPIYDKKAMSELAICRLCSCSASVMGNTQIILLCEKVAKEDIAVRFFEEENGHVVWEAYGEFQHTDVHKQTAITFKTPRYRDINITEPAKVFIQLKRPSDGVTSVPLEFEYVPLSSDPAHSKRKRQRTGGDPMHFLQRLHQNEPNSDGLQSAMPTWNPPNMPAIKSEPRDTSPQPAFGLCRGPAEFIPSPQPMSPSSITPYHNSPSPYNLATAPGGGGGGSGSTTPKAQMLSPNHPQNLQQQQQYNHVTTANRVAASANAGSPIDMHVGGPLGADYSMYAHPQQQSQQLAQQHHAQLQQQTQFPGHHLYESAGATHWGGGGPAAGGDNSKFTNASGALQGNPSNLSNLNNTASAFNMHNLLTTTGGPTTAAAGSGGICVTAAPITATTPTLSGQPSWNIPGSHMYQQNMQQQVLQLQAQQHLAYQQQQQATNTVAGTGVPTVTNSNGHELSALIKFDSEQFVHMNSEDQQNLRLNSEDLSNLSNLSIST